MNSLRTSVEWPYRDITLSFQVMQYKHPPKNFLSTRLVNMMLHQQFCMQTPPKKLFINQVGEHDASSTVLHCILFIQFLCLLYW